MSRAPRQRQIPRAVRTRIAIDLCATIVAVIDDEPHILTVQPEGQSQVSLPAGPLESDHRTLEAGLRSWVEEQTNQTLGYVEQLYTFGDRDRAETDGAAVERSISVAYLALVRQARPAGTMNAAWRDWYRFLPWEDWRAGKPDIYDKLERPLLRWARSAPTRAERRSRSERVELNFGFDRSSRNDERVLERYELLFEAGLVEEATRLTDDAVPPGPSGFGRPMALDHRRILATAIGRLRGKLKYRPVVFELMPPEFTLTQLQSCVEAIAGARLHKQNFRRLVEQEGLVEETGETAETGGRPARLVRFRREVVLERPAPGLRVSAARRAVLP